MTRNTSPMASADKELEKQLLEAGNKLEDPPSSVDDLLRLLNQVESCLLRVEQSPPKSMQDALSPSLKALIDDKLLRHSDVDVKVAVASCISEITRITAPDAPYDDEQMREVFRLIVSSFENLNDESSRSYAKRTSILDTVAKVRSCVVMLDLECDALISEMFQHFMNTIREHHPENVFSSMETIMSLVLEESEDISLDLLSPIIDSVKKDNEEVLPIARRLGEKVLESCATRLKPFLVQAVETLGLSLDDYCDVFASICQETSGNLDQNDVGESQSAKEPVEESTQVVAENAKEAEPPQQDDPVGDRSPKSVMSNGIAQAGEDDALAGSKSLMKPDDIDCSVQSKGDNLSGNEKPNDLNHENVENKKQKPEQATKRRGRKPSSLKMAEPSEGSYLANEKDAEKKVDSKSHSKEVPRSHVDDSAEAAGSSENNNKEINAKISSPKAGDDESDAVASPSPSERIHDESRSKKRGRVKKKYSSAKEVAAEDVSQKVSAGTSDIEVKPTRPSPKKGPGRSSDVKMTTVVDAVKKGSGSHDLDVKKQSAKKTEERNKGSGGSSLRQSEDKKRSGRGKGNPEKGLGKSFAKDEDKEMVSSPKSATKSATEHVEETPKTNLKRKHTPGKENESNDKKYGEELVGTRVKVWWPEDKTFYVGVVDSFDSSIRKHKVLYDDGDQEILNLKKEKWKIIQDDDDSDEEEARDHTSHDDASADMPPTKKGKTIAGESKKEGKRDSASKSGGATSSKSKAASAKSSHKSKTFGKYEDEVGRKSKDQSLKRCDESIDAAPKSKSKNTDSSKISRSKDDDVSTPKPAKSKQETPKTGKSKQGTSKIAAASKAKSTKSGKSNTNGTGKAKSDLLNSTDSENESSDYDSTREVEDLKGKNSTSSKAGSDAKSGKKRRRN